MVCRVIAIWVDLGVERVLSVIFKDLWLVIAAVRGWILRWKLGAGAQICVERDTESTC